MRIIATFVNWKDSPGAIELVCAWDEFSVDGNYDGYTKARDDAVASYGSDILNSITVDIEIDGDAVLAALNPSVALRGKVILGGD